MIDIKDIEKFELPEKIDFFKEEEIQRWLNIKYFRVHLQIINEHPTILDDFLNLKKEEFKNIYSPKNEFDVDEFYEYQKGLDKKIKNYCEKWAYDYYYVYTLLINNYTLCTQFNVSEKRQTIYEDLVLNHFMFLQNDIELINNFKHPTVGGNDAKYVYNGLIYGPEIKEQVSETPPSIDFEFNYTFNNRTMNFYASHKYTHGNGTSQKNQLKDLEKFMDNAEKSNLANDDYFIAWMDGDYYTDQPYPNYRSQTGVRPKVMEYCKSTREREKVKVCNSMTAINTICEIIESWLKKNFKNDEIELEIKKLNTLKEKENY